MDIKLKLYHIIFSFIIIPICLVIIVSYGWSFYATITERSGLNGNMYMYYNLSAAEYSAYKFIVALFAFSLIILQLVYLISKNSHLLTKTFWTFLIFIGLLILFEMYLQTRFVGKG